MSTSDSGDFLVGPLPAADNGGLPGLEALTGVFDPGTLARIANELFSAPPLVLPTQPAGANPSSAPATLPATAPSAPPEVSLPSDPHLPGAPASAGFASISPITTPVHASPPAFPGVVGSSVPTVTSAPVQSGPSAPFSFLEDARPMFAADNSSPAPYPEAKPITQFVTVEPVQLKDPFVVDEKSLPPDVGFMQPPSPTVPAAFVPVDSSAFPAFSFLEEARPLFSSEPAPPGPVPALRTQSATDVEKQPRKLPTQIAPFGFLEESRSITAPDTQVTHEPAGIEPNVPTERDLSSYSFDAEALKRDFPILRERVNGRPLVWLDNAATTQKPQSVIDRLVYFYEHENSNVHRAAHELAARSTDAYESAREKVRRFLNASSSREIVFVRGATEGINLLAQSWGRQNIQKDDEIVITWLEHHANIVPWQMLASEKGARLRVAPVDSTGQILLDEYEKLLGPKTRLVAFPQVSNALGVVTPAAAMIEAAHRYGAKVLLDGAQSVSHMRVDVQSLDCDFFVFSGHKVFAPTGIGVVYAKPEILEHMHPWQGGGNMIQDVTFDKTIYQPAPQRFEAGTGNIADAVGLGAAIDYIERVGMENVTRHEHGLLTFATAKLLEIPGLEIIGTAKEKAGVISFTMDGFRTEEIGDYLNRNGIAVRSGHHCAQPILRRFGLESTVRVSLALYNTFEDIDALIRALWNLRLGQTSIA